MTDAKTAIVTGAGSGIGKQTALMLGSAGYHLVLVGRTASKLQTTADTITSKTLVIAADLADTDAVAQIIPRTLETFGRLDVICHVAGDAPSLPISQTTQAIWRQCIDTNLSCIIGLTAAAWDTFAAQRSGFVANVSSMASFDPFPGFAAYASAKVGLNMFTQCIAREGKDIGVGSVAVAPGAVETPMLRGLFDEQMIPRDKTLDPADVAKVLVDCITGSRPFTSGETIQLPSP